MDLQSMGLYQLIKCIHIRRTKTPILKGEQVLLRKNGKGASVKGLSLEFRLNYSSKIQVESGFTIQESKFEDLVAWSENIGATKSFLRTPNNYGFFTIEYHPNEK